MSLLSKGYSIGSQVYGAYTTIRDKLNKPVDLEANRTRPIDTNTGEQMGERSKLSGFISQAVHKGFAKNAHFRVKINVGGTGPHLSEKESFGKKFTGETIKQINMMCHSTTLPDVAAVPLSASVATDFPYDIVVDMAYAVQSASFYVAEDMFQKKFFDDWLETTYHMSKGQGKYYNDYTTTMEIYQLKNDLSEADINGIVYNEDNDWTYKVTLFNVYPKTVAPVTVDWSSANALSQVGVTFHYTHWESELPKEKTTTKPAKENWRDVSRDESLMAAPSFKLPPAPTTTTPSPARAVTEKVKTFIEDTLGDVTET
jgi:hypothetical protein